VNESEIAQQLPGIVRQVLSVVGKPWVRCSLTEKWGCFADKRTNTILLNPAYLAWAGDPFGGRNNWNRAEHRSFIVGAVAHEVGHLLYPQVHGKESEFLADRVALEVLAVMQLDHEPFSMFLFSTNEGPLHPGGFDRMRFGQQAYVLQRYFPELRR
jgi:hypothetical protein